MATFKDTGDKHQSLLENSTNFKIGKTGRTIKERYDEEYSEEYKNYKTIGTSDKKETIDGFEEYMIERFSDLENCDNEQIGGGEMTDSEKYLVYVVYN